MNLHKKATARANGLDSTSYAPIARALNAVSAEEQAMLQAKFNIAYFMATEQLAFKKYPRLCKLEARHGVTVGASYTNVNACKEFIHYIAESNRKEFNSIFSNASFFSSVMDGSTVASNRENGLILHVVLWCDTDSTDKRDHSRLSFVTVHRPETVSAEGLYESLQYALQCLGIPSLSRQTSIKLVGIGTDGAAANIASGGLRGLVETEL